MTPIDFGVTRSKVIRSNLVSLTDGRTDKCKSKCASLNGGIKMAQRINWLVIAQETNQCI